MAEDYLKKLVRDGVISADQLTEAIDLSSSLGTTVDDALVRLGYVSAGELGQLQAAQYGYEYVDLETMEIPQSIVSMIPESVARENLVIPVALAEERLRDPKLQRLMAKISIQENAEFEKAYPAEMQCRIVVTTKGGESKSAHVRHFKGHIRSPLTDAEVEAKFRTLTEHVVDARQADAIIAKAWQLDKLDDIGEVLALCVVKGK